MIMNNNNGVEEIWPCLCKYVKVRTNKECFISPRCLKVCKILEHWKLIVE